MKPIRNRYGLQFRRFTPLTLAVVLPLVASWLSYWSGVSEKTPYAFGLLSVALVASIGGTLSSATAVAVTVAGRFFFLSIAGQPLPFTRLELARIAVIFAAAMIISGMTSSRRKAQAALEVAHAELQDRTDALVESLQSSKCASWTVDVGNSHGPIWFTGSYPIFGRPFTGTDRLDSFLSAVHPDDREPMVALLEQIKAVSEPILCEFRATSPDGELRWFEMRATPVPGNPSLWRGLTMDITARKFTEAALLRSEKLAAMGRLASTVAHEINNPLEAVTNLLYLAKSDTELNPTTQAYLATAELELARLGDITRLTLGFVRDSASRRNVQITTIADEALSVFRHRLESKGFQIHRIYDPEVAILIAPHELRQILTNLISNAADAANGSPARIAIHIQPASATHAQVVVEDNGIGIDPATLPHIFDPFFTTKPDIGTGIGLWVTRELVESNGGRILVESGALADGVRTRFTLEFPAATN